MAAPQPTHHKYPSKLLKYDQDQIFEHFTQVLSAQLSKPEEAEMSCCGACGGQNQDAKPETKQEQGEQQVQTHNPAESEQE
ncbi:hypothetical protein JYB88_13995 [Shewanella cyperi]|uniref:Uncharacterized protein n=1 Tax=Shewanella cyperi TaxID=2814292 RepID=A0A975AKF9_9GAMM|nr:hypothetical protein [Shewanella cyperi]QSX29312.1 hypothetical protein JYB88_13995 [Shewanella cyperi]